MKRKVLQAMKLATFVAGAAAFCCFATRSASAVEGTITLKADGRQMTGNLSWSGSRKAYDITVDKIQTSVNLDQVAHVQITTPPAGFDAAVKDVQTGRFSAAIPVLKKIFDEHTMLVYDRMAAPWLAQAYIGNKQPKEAVAVCDRLVRDNPDAFGDGALAAAYIDGLQADGQTVRALDVIRKIVELGARDGVAMALLKRGDIEMKRNNYREALIDGYLRTVVLFADVEAAQPEALYKAARCFDQLSQAPYAERMRKQLFQFYPQSPFAERARSGS
jgi:TolA-binding protein